MPSGENTATQVLRKGMLTRWGENWRNGARNAQVRRDVVIRKDPSPRGGREFRHAQAHKERSLRPLRGNSKEKRPYAAGRERKPNPEVNVGKKSFDEEEGGFFLKKGEHRAMKRGEKGRTFRHR